MGDDYVADCGKREDMDDHIGGLYMCVLGSSEI